MQIQHILYSMILVNNQGIEKDSNWIHSGGTILDYLGITIMNSQLWIVNSQSNRIWGITPSNWLLNKVNNIKVNNDSIK